MLDEWEEMIWREPESARSEIFKIFNSNYNHANWHRVIFPTSCSFKYYHFSHSNHCNFNLFNSSSQKKLEHFTSEYVNSIIFLAELTTTTSQSPKLSNSVDLEVKLNFWDISSTSADLESSNSFISLFPDYPIELSDFYDWLRDRGIFDLNFQTSTTMKTIIAKESVWRTNRIFTHQASEEDE